MEKYPFLRFAASVLRVVGWILLVGGIIGSIVLGIGNGAAGGLAGGILGFIIAVAGIILSFLAWVLLLTARELLYLLMDVEENTRNTAERITKESS